MIKRSDALTIKPAPLPASNADLHQNTKSFSLVDRLDIHYMNGLYKLIAPYQNGLIREDTVSGSLTFDKAYAAQTSRKYCQEKGDKVLGALKENVHGRLLSHVYRRHNVSPAQRLLAATIPTVTE